MKTRTHFVSNSSSSSFVCNVCKHNVSGWDMCLSDSGMMMCEQGHTICTDHLDSNITEPSEELKLAVCMSDIKASSSFKNEDQRSEEIKIISEDEDYLSDYYNELVGDKGFSSVGCPVCQFDSLYEHDVFVYLMNTLHLTKDDLAQQLKVKFTTYSNFKNSLHEKDLY